VAQLVQVDGSSEYPRSVVCERARLASSGHGKLDLFVGKSSQKCETQCSVVAAVGQAWSWLGCRLRVCACVGFIACVSRRSGARCTAGLSIALCRPLATGEAESSVTEALMHTTMTVFGELFSALRTTQRTAQHERCRFLPAAVRVRHAARCCFSCWRLCLWPCNGCSRCPIHFRHWQHGRKR
jgi:hypothetical protein